MNLDEIYEANKENAELQAYIALYHVLIEGQEDKWEIWDNFAHNLKARERLELQKRFEVFAKSEIFTKLTRVVLQGNRIVKHEKSFAIDYCRRNEAFLFDAV